MVAVRSRSVTKLSLVDQRVQFGHEIHRILTASVI
jgi:hypothetical protein